MPVSSPKADTHALLEELHCVPSVLQVRPAPPMRTSPLSYPVPPLDLTCYYFSNFPGPLGFVT